jgi:glycosyltransferase involved in cell wall biosynthesis
MRLLFLDFSTKLQSVIDLQTKARGGMVTSLFQVSDALSQLGHSVTVLSDIARGGITLAGVSWVTVSMFDFKDRFDVLICNRGIGKGYSGINAKHRVLWTHDLPHSGFAPEPKRFYAFSKVVFMSKYAKKVWKSFFYDIGRSVIIPNGIDKSIFYPGKEKDLNKLLFFSAPNRGLKRLPLIFEAIKSRMEPDISMDAYTNMGILHPNEVLDSDNDGFSLEYKTANEVGINVYDPIPQRKLAKEIQTAGLTILPTDYPEICSNSILQSLACGTPVITTGGLGSAGEWIKHGKNGMLTKWHPVDYMVHTVEMVRNALKVLKNVKKHQKMIFTAGNTKGLFTWQQIGKKWDRMLRRL